MENEKKIQNYRRKTDSACVPSSSFSRHPCQNNNKIICVHKYKIWISQLCIITVHYTIYNINTRKNERFSVYADIIPLYTNKSNSASRSVFSCRAVAQCCKIVRWKIIPSRFVSLKITSCPSRRVMDVALWRVIQRPTKNERLYYNIYFY